MLAATKATAPVNPAEAGHRRENNRHARAPFLALTDAKAGSTKNLPSAASAPLTHQTIRTGLSPYRGDRDDYASERLRDGGSRAGLRPRS